jgi:hypothetical protein
LPERKEKVTKLSLNRLPWSIPIKSIDAHSGEETKPKAEPKQQESEHTMG